MKAKCNTKYFTPHFRFDQLEINTCLFFICTGPLLICKRGVLAENSDDRKNIVHEFVILFTEMNENESWLLDENIESFSDDPAATKALKFDPGFVASNKMKSINGYIYGNLPGLSMCQGDTVSWHMIGLGTWSDVHNREFSIYLSLSSYFAASISILYIC